MAVVVTVMLTTVNSRKLALGLLPHTLLEASQDFPEIGSLVRQLGLRQRQVVVVVVVAVVVVVVVVVVAGVLVLCVVHVVFVVAVSQ